MTGYKPPLHRLKFEDMPGLEVVVRPISLGKLLDLSGTADELVAGRANSEQIIALCEEFASRLVSWNILGPDDDPVPATLEGVRSLDADIFLQIFREWFGGMTRAPKASTTSTEPTGIDLPMTALRSVG